MLFSLNSVNIDKSIIKITNKNNTVTTEPLSEFIDWLKSINILTIESIDDIVKDGIEGIPYKSIHILTPENKELLLCKK